MTESSLKRYAPLAAALGAVGLLAAGVLGLLRQPASYVQASLAVGLLGLALALLFNPAAVQAWLGRRQARYGGNVALMVLALLGILVVVNYLVIQNDKRWDLSQDQTNTLAPETLNVLKQLSQPVRAIAFYTLENFSRPTAEQLLERYRIESGGQFTFEMVDPNQDPALARQYELTRDGTIVLEMGENREVPASATEEEITGALIRLSNPTERVLYFLTEHGERDFADTAEQGFSQVADVLSKQNYELRPLNLLVTSTVPADASAVVIASPVTPLDEDEITALKQYADGGGSLVVLLDPIVDVDFRMENAGAQPLVDYLGTDWGVTLSNDVVVDMANGFQGNALYPLNSGYGSSPITEELQDVYSVFIGARSVQIPEAGTGPADLTYTALVPADPAAWGETNIDSIGTGPTLDEADVQPPFNLAVSVENTTTGGRLVVFGDSHFASNAISVAGANTLLFTKSVNWTTKEDTLINLTPKLPTTRSLVLTDATTIQLLGLFTVAVLPLLVLLLGVIIWVQRRRHA